jgi:LemA protein
VRAFLIAVLALVAVALAAGTEFSSVRKRLISERNEVASAWQEVEVSLDRRSDLVPGLVETVKGVADDGSVVFRSIAESRSALASARTPQEKIAANERLSNGISRLLLLTEKYRQLRTDKKLLRSEDEIAVAENRIAVERRKYNETLEHYNSSLQTFPDNIVATLSGFRRIDAYFQTDPGGRLQTKEQF